jgi:hypothetical protein
MSYPLVIVFFFAHSTQISIHPCGGSKARRRTNDASTFGISSLLCSGRYVGYDRGWVEPVADAASLIRVLSLVGRHQFSRFSSTAEFPRRKRSTNSVEVGLLPAVSIRSSAFIRLLIFLRRLQWAFGVTRLPRSACCPLCVRRSLLRLRVTTKSCIWTGKYGTLLSRRPIL